jgi:Tfp pilus assembly protein PilO
MMEFLSKLSKKEKIGLSVAALFLVMAFMDRLVIKPIRDRMDNIGHQIKISEEELKLDLRSLNEKKAILQEYEKYARYVVKAGSDEEEVAKILAEIEGLARKSNVYLVDITPQAPRDVDFYKEYIAEIEVEGEMHSIVKFLYQLNDSTLLLRTHKLRINLKEKGSDLVTAVILVTKILVS